MKVIKPQRLGLLQRVVEHDRRQRLVVSVLAYVPLAAPKHLEPEVTLWQHAAECVPGGVVDECVPKPVGEVLVSGSALTRGEAVTGLEVTLVAEREAARLVDKRLVVVGDRFWVGSRPTEPLDFTEMPLDWAHAFGGAGYAENPFGKGVGEVESPHGAVHRLPNIEDPKRPLAGPRDKPAPAGFGAYPVDWPQRRQHYGTRYDQAWLETRYPGPAEDFDARFYCVAPEDQRVEGAWRSGDRFAVRGMHATEAEVSFVVPPLVVKVFAVEREDGAELEGARWRAASSRLDTVHLLPNRGTAILVYRAVLAVREDDAADVTYLLVAGEDEEAPREVEHYRSVLAKRLDKDFAGLMSLKDEDLMPPAERGWLAKPAFGALMDLVKPEGRMLAKAERGRKRALAEARALLEAAGFDVAADFEEAEGAEQAMVDPTDIDAVLAQVRQAIDQSKGLEEEMAARRDQLRAEMEVEGRVWPVDDEAAVAEAAGPPTFSADDHLGMLHDMARVAHQAGTPLEELEADLADPRFDAAMRALEEQSREGYRRMAHLMPAAARPDGERARMLRTLVETAYEAGESLDGRDLTGANLDASI